MTHTIKAVIFDLDGVLVDAREWHYEALNRALGLFGFEINRLEHLTIFDGLPTRTKLDSLSKLKGFPRRLHRIVGELKQKYTREMITLNCRPVYDIENALGRLRRGGYRLGVCTNSIRNSLDLMLELSAIADAFDFTISNEDIPKPKPAPDIYRLALDRLGILPGEALIVEDSPYGIEAAQAAGVHVMAVSDPSEVTYNRIRAAIDAAERKNLGSGRE